MQNAVALQRPTWTLPQKIFFRFFFIYFLLYIAPWMWFGVIPGISTVLSFYSDAVEWLVIKANANFFHVFGIKEVHPVYNGSGDTSYNWAENYLYLSLAAISCIVWSVADRKRSGYRQLNYILCLLVRYNLAMVAFSYGFDKVFYLQMPFPLLSQLATPLGDFLPMRFSWLFIGYSAPYEVFSGVMEVIVGLLLLWRRTATAGVLLSTAVFTNVLMLNLCYDIPVKLYSMNLVLMSLFLLANEYNRIACFFVLNKPASTCTLYDYPLTKKWMRVTRVVLKVIVVAMIGWGVWSTWNYGRQEQVADGKPVKSGVYDVVTFAVNRDTLPPLTTDTLRWQDVIFEKGGMGSINARDTLFRQRYGRNYFFYKPDTLKHTMEWKKFPDDSLAIVSMAYRMPNENTMQLWGKKGPDSLYVELKRSNRHFQLAEKQFHWLSEANR